MHETGQLPGGYSLAVVAGSEFDPSTLPSSPSVKWRRDRMMVQAAMDAVDRLRVSSYRDRELANWAELRAFGRIRDQHCIHFILHRGNCVHGTIRLQFFQIGYTPLQKRPLFEEILQRQTGETGRSIMQIQNSIPCLSSSKFLEVSNWIVNPFIRANRHAAIILAAVPWALGQMMDPFGGIFSARMSNGASSLLGQIGGCPVLADGTPVTVFDPLYQGPVSFMTAHSRNFHPRLQPLVEACSIILKQDGIITHSSLCER